MNSLLIVTIFLPFLTVTHTQAEDGTNEIYFCEESPQGSVEIPATFTKQNVTTLFRTGVKTLKCPNTSIIHSNVSLAEEPTFLFLSSGDIVVPDADYFLRSEYCLKRVSNQTVEIHTCEVRCGETHTCIHKCCPPHQIINGFSCTTSPTKTWKPVFYDTHEGCGTSIDTKEVNYHLLSLSESQTDEFFITPYKHIQFEDPDVGPFEGSRFRLMKDGRIITQDSVGKWATINAGEFCIDGITGYIGNDNYSYNHIEDQVFVSIEKGNTSYENVYDGDEVRDLLEKYFYIPLMSIGAFFLLLTSLLYLLIWEKHNIHGWTIFAYVSTMFFFFFFLAMTKIFAIKATNEFGETIGCKSVGILAHFFYLSTLCWLSVINLDLWLTFRNIKPSGGGAQNVTRFALYSSFAFGVPFLIVAFAVTIDKLYMGSFGDGTECEPVFILPLYGTQQCYLQPGSQLYYLYIPMAIVLTYNIITFSSTVFALCMYRNQARNATGSTSNQTESLVLFAKLFIVTGISWVLELVQSFMTYRVYWIVFDGYNLLQTVLIFTIFALKRENLLFLYQKYPKARCKSTKFEKL